MSRLWSVVTVFLATLVAVTLLVAAVLPAIQGGRVFFREIFNKPSTVVTIDELASETGEAAAEITAAPAARNPADKSSLLNGDEADLVPALARSLYNLRQDYKQGPIGWALTETTDAGEPIEYANGADPPDSLDFFWRTRCGRMLFQYKGEILNWLSVGSTKVLGFLGLILGMIMVPVYLFFFLKDSVSIRDHWHDYVPLRASRFKTELVSTLQEINGYLISFFRGQVVVGVIDGILVGIALFFFDLPYALLIGVFMAILGIIPYIGSILCLIPACIIGYLHAQTAHPFGLNPWPYVGGVVLIFISVQQINSLVTAPKIVGDSVGLHPLTVIFSMLFWSLILGGFVGALLAVPLSAAVKVIFRRYFWDRTMREGSQESSGGFAV
ncbi:MAG: AI-2E family transporter [Armatimonadetes bacterium]|nr:AI-2E family transporter [Akkermansiaceae bacterium]